MRNREKWTPTKFLFEKGRLQANRDGDHVAPSSWLVTDRVATMYTDVIPAHVRGRLLDLGCGEVPLYEAYRELVTENICVDWENSLHPNPFLDLCADLTAGLDLASGSFDTILLSDVLEHIPEPQALFVELDRLLGPGGKLILNVPFYYELHEQPHDYYRYTEFALRRFAEYVDFEVLGLAPIGGLPEVFADLFAKTLRNRWWGRGLGMLAQRAVSRALSTRRGQELSRSTSRRSPLGYYMVAQKKPKNGCSGFPNALSDQAPPGSFP